MSTHKAIKAIKAIISVTSTFTRKEIDNFMYAVLKLMINTFIQI